MSKAGEDQEADKPFPAAQLDLRAYSPSGLCSCQDSRNRTCVSAFPLLSADPSLKFQMGYRVSTRVEIDSYPELEVSPDHRAVGVLGVNIAVDEVVVAVSLEAPILSMLLFSERAWELGGRRSLQLLLDLVLA